MSTVLLWVRFPTNIRQTPGVSISKVIVIATLPGGMLEPLIMYGMGAVNSQQPAVLLISEMLVNVMFYSICVYIPIVILTRITNVLTTSGGA